MFGESNQIKVLVADDNREFCGILRDYFTNEPEFELVEVCANGMEVLDVIAKKEVEVLILDLIMPYVDGIGVLERINEMRLDPRPKIVILTAFGQENITQKAVQLSRYYILNRLTCKSWGKELNK